MDVQLSCVSRTVKAVVVMARLHTFGLKLLPPEPVMHHVQIGEAMKDLESWEHFNVFEVAKLVKGHILATVVFYALEHFDLFEKLDIPEDKFYNFVAVCSQASLPLTSF